MDLTILFIHLKIILLQCFQFSVISDIQTHNFLRRAIHELATKSKNVPKKKKKVPQKPKASY